MSCSLDINDIVNEMKKSGEITPVAGLPVEQVSGILTAIVKTVNQPADTISEKGLGSYGLSLEDLQLVGVVKCGFSPQGDLITVLSDSSVLTGKYGLTDIDDLLADEGLQQELMNEVMVLTMADLQAQGIITGNETDQELAALAGQSSEFSSSDIISNLLGTAGDLLGSAMDALGKLAAAGALIAALKNADILGKLKGFGAKITSVPIFNTDITADAALNSNADAIGGMGNLVQTTTDSALDKAPAAPPSPAPSPLVPSLTITEL